MKTYLEQLDTLLTTVVTEYNVAKERLCSLNRTEISDGGDRHESVEVGQHQADTRRAKIEKTPVAPKEMKPTKSMMSFRYRNIVAPKSCVMVGKTNGTPDNGALPNSETVTSSSEIQEIKSNGMHNF
jgi:hypothetical protein